METIESSAFSLVRFALRLIRGDDSTRWLTALEFCLKDCGRVVHEYSFRMGAIQVFWRVTKIAARGDKALGGIHVPNQFYGVRMLLGPGASAHGPGLILAEKGAAGAGTAHAYCAGQPGSVPAFRQSVVKLLITFPRTIGPSSGSA